MRREISPENMAALTEALLQGRKIPAIKLYREVTGLGLKESKEDVEAMEASLRARFPDKFAAPPKGRGCFGAAAALCVCGSGVVWWFVTR